MSPTSWSTALLSLLSLLALAHAHTVITYPGWRGDNLHTNGTVQDTNGLGVAPASNGSEQYPYGMQWMYPCKLPPSPPHPNPY